MDANSSDLNFVEDVVGYERDGDATDSIRRFLTLPTVTARVTQKFRDPIMDFTKSIMLTSDEYVNATAQVRQAKADAARDKERAREEKELRKQQKVLEREEEKRQKEAHATDLAHARLLKIVHREEAQMAKAQRALELAEARTQREAKKEQKIADRLEAQRRKVSATAERIEGRQAQRHDAQPSLFVEQDQSTPRFSFDAPNLPSVPIYQSHATTRNMRRRIG